MATSKMSPIDKLDHAKGAASPAVTIVLYGDYDCPHTRASYPILEKLMREQPDVGLVFRHFPLRQIHPNAEMLARIAEGAAKQGKFWEMHARLMLHRRAIDEWTSRPATPSASASNATFRAGAPAGCTARPRSSSGTHCTMVTTTTAR